MGKAWCASWLKARQRNPDTIFPKRKALNPIFTLQHIPLVQTSEKQGLKILGRFLPKKKKKNSFGDWCSLPVRAALTFGNVRFQAAALEMPPLLLLHVSIRFLPSHVA